MSGTMSKMTAFDKAWGVVKEYTPEEFRDHGDADYEFYSQPEDELEREGSFSKQPCDTCHQHLAGDRYKVTAANKDTEPIDLSICQDCLMRLVGGYSWNQKDQVYE